MMKTLNRWLVTAGLVLGAAPVLAAGAHDHGHEHAQAHVHGAVQLEVALDGPTLSIALEAPLDSLLGFERAPRTARVVLARAAAWAARLASGTGSGSKVEGSSGEFTTNRRGFRRPKGNPT